MTFAGRLGRQRRKQAFGSAKPASAEPSVPRQAAGPGDAGRWASVVRLPRWCFFRIAHGGRGSGAGQQTQAPQILTTAGPPAVSVAGQKQQAVARRAARGAHTSRLGLRLPTWFSSHEASSNIAEAHALNLGLRERAEADNPADARSPEQKDPLHAQSCALLDEVRAAGTGKDACLWRLVSLMYEQSLNDDELASLLESCPEVRWIAQCASRTPLPPGWRKDLALRIFICEATGTVSATPPNIAQFVQLARLAMHARRAPQEALVARKWVESMMQEAIQEAGRTSEEWSGPHVDAETGLEYYHCPTTGMSSWENPSAGSAFLACVAHRLLQSEAFPDDTQRSSTLGPQQPPNAETLFLAGLAAHLLHRDPAHTGQLGNAQHQGMAMRLQPLAAAADRAARRPAYDAENGGVDVTAASSTQAHLSRTATAVVCPGEQIEIDDRPFLLTESGSTGLQGACLNAESPELEDVEQLLQSMEGATSQNWPSQEKEEHSFQGRGDGEERRRRKDEEDAQKEHERRKGRQEEQEERSWLSREEEERRRFREEEDARTRQEHEGMKEHERIRRRQEEEERSRRRHLAERFVRRLECGPGEEAGSNASTFGLSAELGEAKSAALAEEDHASCWSFGDNADVDHADVPVSNSSVDANDLMHLKSLLAPPVGSHGDTIESILADLADDLSEASDVGKITMQQQQRHLTFADAVEAEVSETAPHGRAAPSQPADVAAGASSCSPLASVPTASRLAPLPFTPVVRAEIPVVEKLPSMESIIQGGPTVSLSDMLQKPATVKVERWPCSTPFSKKRTSAPTKLAAMMPSTAPMPGASATEVHTPPRPRASPAGPGWQPPPHSPIEAHKSPRGRAETIKRTLKGVSGPSMLAPPPGIHRTCDNG